MCIIVVMTMPGEDWLNPSVMLEAFEARAARMAVGCGMRVAKAPDSESGEYFHVYFHRPCAWIGYCISLQSLAQQSDFMYIASI
jgi:hypothetical protein